MLWTGMRPGELLALQSGDIRLESISSATVLIRRSLKLRSTKSSTGESQSRWYVATGKNEFSAREVAIEGEEVVIVLRNLCNTKIDSDWLFPSKTKGQPFVSPEQFSKEFRRCADKRGVSPTTSGKKRSELVAYDLRGLHITHLVSLGEDVVSIADRVGHKDPVTLLRRYSGVVRGRDREVARSARQPLKPTGKFSMRRPQES
jgi:integrase